MSGSPFVHSLRQSGVVGNRQLCFALRHVGRCMQYTIMPACLCLPPACVLPASMQMHDMRPSDIETRRQLQGLPRRAASRIDD
mmetsp:Transcript_30685/g.90959  ORF Transcript_30685/g.90959 Transcript_30685/m.90959 type:complete len:83 (+) Transcript_30685:817-1065(+)